MIDFVWDLPAGGLELDVGATGRCIGGKEQPHSLKPSVRAERCAGNIDNVQLGSEVLIKGIH